MNRVFNTFNSAFPFLTRHYFELIFLISGRFDFFRNALAHFNKRKYFLKIIDEVETSSGRHTARFTLYEIEVNKRLDTAFLLFF